MKRPEQVLQRKLLTKLFRTYPVGFVFHVPNSAKRSKIEGYNMKLNGVKSGVCDLVIVRPYGRVGWVEVKDPENGVLSGNQEAFRDTLLPMGHTVYEIDAVDQLTPIIAQWVKEDAENDAFIEKWKP